MQFMMLTVLLVIANVAGAGMIVPQVVRLRRHSVVEGLSGAWIGVGLTMNLWWVAYAVNEGLWGIVPVSISGLALYAIIASQLNRIVGAEALYPLAVGGLTIGVVPVPFLLIGGWPAAGLAIGLCYGVQFAPAALTALRSERLDGMSPTTWMLAWIEAAIWLSYGAATNDAALLVGGAGGTLMASVILARMVQSALARYETHGDTPELQPTCSTLRPQVSICADEPRQTA